MLKGNFNFEWQMGYEFAEPIALPKGTKLRFITHFDNSPANRFNPDPTKKVVWGPQNWDEMSNCFIGVLFDRGVDVAKGVPALGPEPAAARRRRARRSPPSTDDRRQRGRRRPTAGPRASSDSVVVQA